MASTGRLTSPHSGKDPIKALHDPFGHGYEGRIGVDRETSAHRKGIAAVLHQFAARGIKAPEAAQYDYLITHGFYTVEELNEVSTSYPSSFTVWAPPPRIQGTK